MDKTLKEDTNNSLFDWAGLILTPLRLCTGWIIFSACWRRLVLKPEALDVLSPMYEGLKFNHFIPSATAFGSFIKYMVLHPHLLLVFLWIFTIIEGIVGLCLLLGLFTRLASLVSFFLLLGIMLGAGWLGTTCVDEWQIGVFGTSASIVLFLAGGGIFALDHLLAKSANGFSSFWSSAPLFKREERRRMYKLALFLSLFALALALITNQVNVGGVWGPFKNKAIKPHLTLSNVTLSPNGALAMNIYRDAGPDTYGSFVVSVRVLDKSGKVVLDFDAAQLGSLSQSQIDNHYLVKVQPNGRSLVVPLGAFARVQLNPQTPITLPPGNYEVEVTDVDGLSWKAKVELQSALNNL